jgi:hypothetical protein
MWKISRYKCVAGIFALALAALSNHAMADVDDQFPQTRPAVPLVPEVPSAGSSAQTDQQDQSFIVFGDASGSHTSSANIHGTDGNVSSTRAGVKIGAQIPVNDRLSFGVSADWANTFYRFNGASGFTPDGVRPWGTVQVFSIGGRFKYHIDDNWTVLAEINGASSGEQGAKFGSTLTGGGSAGATYRFSDSLTAGLVLAGESQLESHPLIVPFPVVDWVLPIDPQNRFRLVSGDVRTGPSQSVGVELIFSPIKQLSFAAGLAGLGIGNNFRLDKNGPVPNGVGRDNSYPIVAGVNWDPSPMFSLGGFVGVNTNDTLDMIDAAGLRVNKENLNAAFMFGVNGSIRF